MSVGERRVLVEIAVESEDGARAAAAGGADRVELGANLAQGGTTPSAGVLETTLAAAAALRVPVIVLVRPRAGDFLYSRAEFDSMLRDVAHAKAAGAAGVAIGVLLSDGSVDVERTTALVRAARPMTVTFHRAFDMTRDEGEALDALMAIGVDRVLTSGRRASAEEGLPCLAALVTRAGGRLSVMPGAGIRSRNAREVARASGAREIHLSASRVEPSAMTYRNALCTMGPGSRAGEFERLATDPDEVRRVTDALREPAP